MRLRDRICGVCLSLPIFAELTGGGLKLPENHFEMDGTPLHASMIALLILLPSFKFAKKHLLMLVCFVIYLLFCLMQDVMRAVLAVQSIYFFACYFLLESLEPSRLRVIGLTAVKSILVFLILHLGSLIVSANSSVFGALAGAGNFWGLTIYQSHLTYPLCMIFGLWMSGFYRNELGRLSVVLLVCVAILEAVLLRKTAMAIFVSYFIFYRPKLVIGLLLPLGMIISIVLLIGPFTLDFLATLLERFVFSRENAWRGSLDVLSEVDVLLFGNGTNNYSHNYFLHTVSTHGVIYGLMIFSILASIMLRFFRRVGYAFAPCALVLSVMLVDWNVNTNLYQPYYAGLFALALLTAQQNSQMAKKLSTDKKFR